MRGRAHTPAGAVSPSRPLATSIVVPMVALLMAAMALGCNKSGELKPAPPPYRPKRIKKPAVEGDRRVDCDPTDTKKLPAALTYQERSIEEAENLANDALTLLKQAENRKIPKIEREDLITQSVQLFITALLADPYNVNATYNLAAAYARIGRGQCAVNLLARLAELRKLRSQTVEVEEKLDRLLGRGKYRNNLDPDFLDLRDEENFRELVKQF